jgi:hypothetical protein
MLRAEFLPGETLVGAGFAALLEGATPRCLEEPR